MIKIATAELAKSCPTLGTSGVALYELPYSFIVADNVVEKDTLSLVPFEIQHYSTLGSCSDFNVGALYPLFVLEETDTGWAMGIYQNYGNAYFSFIPTAVLNGFPTQRFSDDGNSVFLLWDRGQRRARENKITVYDANKLAYIFGFNNPFFSELKPILLSGFPQSAYPTDSYEQVCIFYTAGVFEYGDSYKHIVVRVGSTKQNNYPFISIFICTEDGTSVSYTEVFKDNPFTVGAVPLYYDSINKKFHLLIPKGDNCRIATIDLGANSSSQKDVTIPMHSCFLPAFVNAESSTSFYVAYVKNDTGQLVLSRMVFDYINREFTETVIDSSLPEVASARLSKSTTVIRFEKVEVGNDTYYLLFLESRLTGKGGNLSSQNQSGDNLAKVWIYKESNGTLEKVGELELPFVIRCIAFSKDRKTAVFGLESGTFLLTADSTSNIGFSFKALSSVIPVAVGRDSYDRFWIMDTAGDIYLYSPVLPFDVQARLELPTHYIKEGETIQGKLYVKVVNDKGELMSATVRLVSRNPDVALLGTENNQVVDITTSTDGETQVPVTVYRRGKVIIDRYLLSVTLGG